VALPYTPVVLSAPIVNPSVGSVGGTTIPYISNSQYTFAPTAMNVQNIGPGPVQNAQILADTIRRASRWADTICFGADVASTGAGLAAGLSVESVNVRLKGGVLRLVCDYRPIQQVIGVDVGPDPSNVASIGPNIAASVSIGRRTIFVPFVGIPIRAGDVGSPVPYSAYPGGTVYAVWSYVYGYAHTELVADVAKGATSCVVRATNGTGGVWGVFPNITSLLISDSENTETVMVTGVTTGSDTTTLTTTPFDNAHTLPESPDFIPVSALGDDIHQAVISLTTMVIKLRGVGSMVMPSAPGGKPSGKALSQAGAEGDWGTACRLLTPYRIRNKAKV
jgi:hypothetical protein